MFKNYLLVALRNLWKNKLHFFINVGGMAVALTCSLFILLAVYRHVTFDEAVPNQDKLYKLYGQSSTPRGFEVGTSMPYPLRPALKAEHTGVARVSGMLGRGKLVRYKDKTLDMGSTLVDPDFIPMFGLQVVHGNEVNPLQDPGNVVLSENSGKEEPVGKTIAIKIGGEWKPLMVTAVLKDLPENTSIRYNLLARMELDPDYAGARNEWSRQNHTAFVQLAGNVTQQEAESRLRNVMKKYRPDNIVEEKKAGNLPDKNGDYNSYRLLPYKDIHFNPQLGGGGSVNRSVLYVLALIGMVILLIASFNFVNLNVGLSYTRTKEIGIRKCLGAGKRQIWMQVWGESAAMVLLAMLVAIGLVLVLIGSFNQTFNNVMSAGMLLRPDVIALLISLVLVISFIASGYPSGIMARLRTVEVLKGKIAVKKPGLVRNSLIVTQFVIAIVLIVSTVIIYQQFKYLRAAPLGYNTSSIISIPIKNDDKGKEVVTRLRNRLSSQPSVIAVTGCNANLGLGEDKSSSTSIMCFDYEGNTICGQTLEADYDVLKTLDVKPIAGNDFNSSYTSDASLIPVIASESYAAQFGKKNVAGFTYITDTADPRVTVVGIIPDIKLRSITTEQKPLVISLAGNSSHLSYAWVKVSTNNPAITMDMVKREYAAVEPNVEFKGSYVNENIDRMYSEEMMMANIFSFAAGIAIVLSCMGLFGMAAIIIRQRVKEIGVRKVLGASVNSIVVLVSKEFLKPVAIAFLIAVPIAWWALHTWLADYSYRVGINWWVFAIAGMLTLLVTICTISFQSIKAAVTNPVKTLRDA
jgi:putative ABC transport system permease protein